jgi:hypothetical protein
MIYSYKLIRAHVYCMLLETYLLHNVSYIVCGGFVFAERDARYSKWKMAVKRSLGWATTKKSLAMTGTV